MTCQHDYDPAHVVDDLYVCPRCAYRVPSFWGCGKCQWSNFSTLGDVVSRWQLVYPCLDHLGQSAEWTAPGQLIPARGAR